MTTNAQAWTEAAELAELYRTAIIRAIRRIDDLDPAEARRHLDAAVGYDELGLDGVELDA